MLDSLEQSANRVNREFKDHVVTPGSLASRALLDQLVNQVRMEMLALLAALVHRELLDRLAALEVLVYQATLAAVVLPVPSVVWVTPEHLVLRVQLGRREVQDSRD
jgi:hypothetical protein